MNKKEEALKNFRTKYNCSQTIVEVFADEIGLDKETALKIAKGFGGGAQRGELCGAVSAGIMVLGMKYGDDAKPYIEDFEDQMEELYGSIRCEKILGVNPSYRHGKEVIEKNNLQAQICPGIVEDSVLILEGIMRG